MPEKRTPTPALVGIITLAIFLSALALVRARLYLPPYARLWRSVQDNYGDLVASLDYSIVLVLGALLGVMLLNRRRTLGAAIAGLGLTQPLVPAFAFAFLASLPMLIGYSITGSASWDWSLLLRGTLIAAVVEEVFFRGFAYRMLHEHARWRFWLAAGFTGLVFGVTHVPPSTLLSLNLNAGHLLTILITTARGVFYAWLFMRWRFNLWVPIFLHLFMNLWWMMFAAGDGAVGGLTANLCRALTIAAAVVLTLYGQRVVMLRRR